MSPIHLREPTLADQEDFLIRVRASRPLHQPWVSAPDTPAKFQAYIARMSQPDHLAFLVCLLHSDEIVGIINISNIVRGLFRSGYLSYYCFFGFEGRGYMSAGLRAVVRQAFGKQKLHRLEANIQPGNTASIALVKACGFTQEGYSPRYLKIGGRWRDHERWALVSP